MDSAATAIHGKAFAAHYESALHRRQVTLRQHGGGVKHAAFVAYGRVSVAGPEHDIGVDAPGVIWCSTAADAALSIETGSEVLLLGATEELVAEAVGQTVEAVFLRYVLHRSFAVPLADAREPLAECERCFAGIVAELQRDGTGSWMLITAYLRIIVVHLWRASAINEIIDRNHGDTSIILQKFRHLVELHFREHWPIRDYCAAVGISHDRLHAICARALGRTPLQLLHERLTYEAQLLLERTALTVDQISEALGFRDASGFSHFFKRRTGMAPRSYRIRFTLKRSDPFKASDRSFADWP